MNFSGPRVLLHLEGLAMLVGATALYAHAGAPWGRFALLFLAPDLSALGFLLGPKIGAVTYDAAHTYLGPLGLWVLGTSMPQAALCPLAFVWAAHIGFDRAIGYGLKYATGFKDTHLARV